MIKQISFSRIFSKIFVPVYSVKLVLPMLIFTLIFGTTLPAFASAPSAAFPDVSSGHWASDQIRTLANWQVIDGETDGKYSPENNLRRSELAKLLAVAFQLQKIDDESDAETQTESTSTTESMEAEKGTSGLQAQNMTSFEDLKDDHWAVSYISSMVEADWLAGFPDGCFKPDEYTTRAQIAKILCKAKGFNTITTEDTTETTTTATTITTTFKDVSSKHWAFSYIETAADNKLLNGYPDGMFKPDDKVTRAEAAALIYRAQVDSDYLVESEIKSGVSYERYRRFSDSGSLNIHVVNVPNSASVAANLGLAKDKVTGFERVSSMAERYGALVAINGDFFSSDGKNGSSGILADKQLISSPINSRSYFGVYSDGSYFINRATMQAMVTAFNGKKGIISWVNKCRDSFTDTIVAYTPTYGLTTKTATDTGTEVVLELDNMPVTTEFETTATVVEVRSDDGNSNIPAGGIVLSGIGSSKTYLDANFKPGDPVSMSISMTPPVQSNAIVIGGGPRLVRDGIADVESEGFTSINGRRARTGLGYDSEGNLIIIVVDGGLDDFSIGMTLSELADELENRGAVDAMNLDGGTSSTLYFNGAVRNYPGQGGGERAVCSSLLFISAQ